MELPVGHDQVHAVAGHPGGVLSTLVVAIKGHLTAGFNVLELLRVYAGHQAQQGFEVGFQRPEGQVVGDVGGVGQADGAREAERKVVEPNLVFLEGVQIPGQVQAHRHVAGQLLVGHVSYPVVAHVQVGGRGARGQVEHVAGEVAAAGVVHAARLHPKRQTQVLVAQAPAGDFPPLDGEVHLAGVLPLGGGGRVRNHHVPVGQAAFQHAQAQIRPFQLHGFDVNLPPAHHAHYVQPHAQRRQVGQRVAAERVEPNHAQVADVQC